MREDPKVTPTDAETLLVDLWKKAISGDAHCIDAVRTIIARIPSRRSFFLLENDDDN